MMRATQLISLFGFVSASHFRYGTISWTPQAGNSVRIRTETAWRRSYWGPARAPGASGIGADDFIAKGDTFVVPSGQQDNKFYFGDTDANGEASFVRLSVRCTSPESSSDYNYRIDNAMGDSTMDHTYATPTNGANAWMAGFSGCCRLGARPDGDPNSDEQGKIVEEGLNNNGARKWDIHTKIDLKPGPNMNNASPFAVGRPILRLRIDEDEKFDIVAIDQENDDLTWELGSGTDMGEADNKQPGFGINKRRDGSDMTAGNKVQMVNEQYIGLDGTFITVGEMHWGTHGLQTGYWQSTVMITTPGWDGATGMFDGVRRVEGGRATIPYDFLMVLQDPKGNNPPFWIEPTPCTTCELKANCPSTITYTVRADDSEKGQNLEMMKADRLNIFEINFPPNGMVHSDLMAPAGLDQAKGLNATKKEYNPIEKVATWGVTCSNAGKHVICYQAEDFNLAQALDSRVRCVRISVKEVVNNPPTFCGVTPAENAKIPVCVGKQVSFAVQVCDADEDTVTIDWISGVPAGAVTPDEVYEGAKNNAKRTFNLTPNQDIVEGSVCFRGTDNTAKESDKYTSTRCVLLSIRYSPRFILPTPQMEEGAKAIIAHVCEETTFTVRAADKNEEDDVRIFVLEDPGLPNGAVVEQDVCPPPKVKGGEGAGKGPVQVPCNHVDRTFRWSPIKSQGGRTYRICFTARDNKDNCIQGGFYSDDTPCVDVTVVGSAVQWAAGTPAADKNFNAYVGATLGFNVISEDVNYAVGVSVHGDFPLPTGASLSQCVRVAPAPAPAAGERRRSLQATQQCSRGFSWKPKRGQEAFSYKTCFTAHDDVCPDTVGHDAVAFSEATHMNTIGPLCVNIHVIRCKYGVNEGDTLHYLSKFYHLDTNWLRIWNSNGNDDLDSATDTIHNPNTILHSEDILNVGPVYKVQAGDTMIALAARFHTTVKKIISVNPDLTEDHAALMPGQDLCVMPCTDSPHVHSNTYKYAY